MNKGVTDVRLFKGPAIIYAIAGLYAVLVLLVFPNFTIDDAFITFRYAENLANHGVLTWNVDEPPVEGYTGVFLPVVLALLMKHGVSPAVAAKTIGIASLFIGGFIIMVLLSGSGIRAAVTGIVLILYFGAPFAYVHALSGLETTLFSTAILASILAMLRCLDPSGRHRFKDTTLLLSLLMVSLIRPEGFVLSTLFGLTVLLVKKRQGNNSVRFVVLGIALYALPIVAYLVWKYSYYGQLLPNTFYAKAYEGNFFNPDTAIDFGKFVITYCAVVASACILLLFANRHAVRLEFSRALKEPLSPLQWTWIGAWLFVAVALFQYMRTSLAMNFSSRFFFPFFPIFIMTSGLMFDRALTWTAQKAHGAWRAGVVIAAAVAVQIGLYALVLKHDIAYYRVYRQIIEHAAVPAADFLKQNVPAREWLAVHSDAGAVPYYSKMKTVDFGGLNDKVLAAKPRPSEEERVNYFFAANPGAVLFTSVRWDTLDHDEEAKAIVEDPRFSRYTLVKKFSGPGSVFRWRPYFFMKERTDEYYYFLYVRKDLLPTKPAARLDTFAQ
jgi:hypothetical protein